MLTDMKQIEDTISLAELKLMSERMYGSLVKADVDVTIRPRQQNPSRDVLNISIREEINKVVSERVRE